MRREGEEESVPVSIFMTSSHCFKSNKKKRETESEATLGRERDTLVFLLPSTRSDGLTMMKFDRSFMSNQSYEWSSHLTIDIHTVAPSSHPHLTIHSRPFNIFTFLSLSLPFLLRLRGHTYTYTLNGEKKLWLYTHICIFTSSERTERKEAILLNTTTTISTKRLSLFLSDQRASDESDLWKQLIPFQNIDF